MSWKTLITVGGLALLGLVLALGAPRWQPTAPPGHGPVLATGGETAGPSGLSLIAEALAAPSPPSADAGLDRTVALGATVVLDGSRSTNAANKVLAFNWNLVTKPVGSGAQLSDAAAVKPSFEVDLPGLYTFVLTVTEGNRTSPGDIVLISTLNSAPVARAGADQGVALAATVVLDGSASDDADGEGLSFAWSLVSVPVGSGAVLSDPGAVRPTFTADLAGDYLAELVVDDGQAASAADSVTVTTDNVAPVADAGPDRRALVGQTLQFGGDGSSDADGDELTLDWTLAARPAGSSAKLTIPPSNRPILTIDLPGLYVVQVEADDGQLTSAPDTAVVSTLNSAPVAAAGPDQSVVVSEVVTLDGAGSSDVDGDALSFAWALVARPAGSAAALSNPGAVRPSFSADLPGNYVARLIVDDGAEPSAADTVTVTTEGSRPLAEAGPAQSVARNDVVQLDGTASADADLDPLSFHWALLRLAKNSNATLSDPDVAQPTFTADKAGTYVAQLIVDDGTLTSAPDTVTITTVDSQPIANAGPDQSLFGKPLVQLDGSASFDPDLDPLTFAWALIVKPAGSVVQLSDPGIVNPTFTPDLSGSYLIQLIVDDGGHESAPDTVAVEIVNRQPIADAGPDQQHVVPVLVQLDGSGSSDPDLDPLTFAWTLVNVPPGSSAQLSDPNIVNPTFSADLPGPYVAQLVVDDGELPSAPDAVIITVTNAPPVADAGPDQAVTAADTVQLDGSASFDPDLHPITFSWSLTTIPAGSLAELSDPGIVNPSFLADVPGGYVAVLVVNDGFVNSAPDGALIMASPPAGNLPPFLAAVGDQSVDVGATLTLTLQASDPNNDPVSFSALPLPLPDGASLDGTSGVFTFQPGLAQVGAIALSFVASDGVLSTSEAITITVVGPVMGAPTELSGRLLDSNSFAQGGAEVPVVNAEVSIVGSGVPPVMSDAGGNFTLTGLPSGTQVLFIDSSTADPSPDPLNPDYAGFQEELELIAEAVNIVERAFFLPRIAAESLTVIDPNVTVMVENPTLGVSIEVPPNTAKDEMGQDFTGELSISLVPAALAPVALPDELRPALLVTIQPIGVTFATPIPLTFPNLDNLIAGSVLEIWSLDPNTGGFAIVGSAQVSAGGLDIVTTSGGVSSATWHTILPSRPEPDPEPEIRIVRGVGGGPGPGPSGGGGDLIFPPPPPPPPPPECTSSVIPCCNCTGSVTSMRSGRLSETHTTASYRSLGRDRGLNFIYSSESADPRGIVSAGSTIPFESAVPETVSTRLSVAGVAQGAELFTSTAGLSEASDETIRQALRFDAAPFATGSYRYLFTITNNFALTSVGRTSGGSVLVDNEQASPFGAGWTLDGLQRVHPQADGGAVLTEGDGGVMRFQAAIGGTPFIPAGNFGAINDPQAHVADDFDGDGNLDLAVPDSLGNRVVVLLGDGAGGFTTNPGLEFSTLGHTRPRSLASGDFNGDLIRDLVIGTSGTTIDTTHRVKVRLGVGDGTFGAPVVLDLDRTRIQSVAVADFDGDGNQDIAAASATRVGFNGVAGVFYGDGLGGFTAAVLLRNGGLNMPTPAISLVATDLNGDTLADVAVVISQDNPAALDDLLFVWTSNGAARTFNSVNTLGFQVGNISFAGGRWALGAADFNGDTEIDLIVTNHLLDRIALLQADGAGSFSLAGNFTTADGLGGGVGPISLAVDDYDGDGIQDVATANGLSGDVSVLAGDGLGGFSAPAIVPVVAAPVGLVFRAVVAADLDNDTAPDLSITNPGEAAVSILLGTGAGADQLQAPAGEFSTLIKNGDGSFTRTLKGGTVIEFDPAGLMTSVTDRNGNATIFAYDGSDRVTTITDHMGLITTLSYGAGQVTITDPAARVTTLTIDGNGDLSQIQDPDLTIRQFAYDTRHRMTFQTSKRNFSTTYDYNFAGQMVQANWPDASTRLVSPSRAVGLIDTSGGLGTEGNPAPFTRPEDVVATFTDGNGNLTTYELDQFGTATKQTDALGRINSATRDSNGNPTQNVAAQGTADEVTGDKTYDALGNLLTRREAVGTALERVTAFTYEPNFNRVAAITDPELTLTNLAYDANGNLTTVTAAVGTADEVITERQYLDPACPGQATALVRAKGVVGEETTTTFEYDPATCNLAAAVDAEGNRAEFGRDGAGNILIITEAVGEPQTRVTAFTYDALNRVLTAIDGSGVITTFRYNDAGDLEETELATGEIQGRGYDQVGRVTVIDDPATGISTIGYDGAGNRDGLTDARGELTRFRFDVVNRLIKTIDASNTIVTPEPACGDPGVTCFSHDLRDNVKNLQDARGQTTSFLYDVLDRRTQRTNELGQLVTFDDYDARDKLKQATDAKGQVTTLLYDALARLTEIKTFDDLAALQNTITLGYDHRNNVTSVTDDDSDLALDYDGRDRLITADTLIGGIQPVVTMTALYDGLGDRTQLSDSLGGITGFAYDGAGRLQTLTPSLGGALTLGYDLAGRLDQILRPNGIDTGVAYEAITGRLDLVSHGDGVTDLVRLDYGLYDAVGHIGEIVELNRTLSFAYDELNRLTAGGTVAAPESYDYDDVGNRTVSHLSAAHVTDGANRLTEDDQFCYVYELTGNLESKTAKVAGVCTGAVTGYTYDVQNQLTRIDFPGGSFAAYRYDGVSRRIEKDVDGAITRYVYDGANIVLEFDGADVLQARYSHGQGVDQPLAMERGGAIHYYHADHRSSVRLITDSMGAVVNEYDYDAYGRFVTITEGVVNPFTFTGREHDAESGLYYYRARTYDPETGRFLQEDPIGFLGGDVNLYRYVFNNPVSLTDPSGLFLFLFGSGATGTAAGGVDASSGLVIDAFTGEVGTFVAGGVSVGANVSGDIFIGFFLGDITKFEEPTGFVNVVIPVLFLSLTVFIDPVDGIMGGTLGIGPSFPAPVLGSAGYTDAKVRKIFDPCLTSAGPN